MWPASWEINNFRYADDTTLIAESIEKLKSILMKVRKSEKGGLKLCIQKKEGGDVMKIKITADGDCSHEIKRRLLLGRKVHHVGTWDSPVGKPLGKASWESLQGKPQVPWSTRREAWHCCHSSGVKHNYFSVCLGTFLLSEVLKNNSPQIRQNHDSPTLTCIKDFIWLGN